MASVFPPAPAQASTTRPPGGGATSSATSWLPSSITSNIPSRNADRPKAFTRVSSTRPAGASGVARVATFPVPRIGMFAMVIRAAGPTKGTAVEWLAKHHGCTAAEVVVVGDWVNDVPMFRVAGRSFVMGQAPAQVKAAATDELVADCIAGGGIAEAVRRAWGL